MNKYKVDSYSCVLTEERWINLELLVVNNVEGGSIEMSFSMSDLSEKMADKNVICKFDSYIFVNTLDEFYDTNEVVYSNLDKDESIHGKFGPVAFYDRSPWIDKGDRVLLFDDKLPRHYLFITSDDIVEILSHDEPVFTVVEKKSE